MINVAVAAVASAAVIEMGHYRQFQFTDELTALDGFNAIARGADQSGDFPVLHEVQDMLVSVDEANGEAAMRSLKQAGVPFKYSRVWRPVDEVWPVVPADMDCASDLDNALAA